MEDLAIPLLVLSWDRIIGLRGILGGQWDFTRDLHPLDLEREIDWSRHILPMGVLALPINSLCHCLFLLCRICLQGSLVASLGWQLRPNQPRVLLHPQTCSHWVLHPQASGLFPQGAGVQHCQRQAERMTPSRGSSTASLEQVQARSADWTLLEPSAVKLVLCPQNPIWDSKAAQRLQSTLCLVQSCL